MRIVVVFATLLSGCATTATEFRTKDGSRGYRINCDYDPGEGCVQKANDLCPAGFDPLAQSDDIYMGSSMTVKCAEIEWEEP